MVEQESIKIACVQVTSSEDISENIEAVSVLIRHAVRDGAKFITTPECVGLLSWNRKLIYSSADDLNQHVVVQALGALAAELKVWILVGSIFVRLKNNKLVNRSVMLDDSGSVATFYDKIHLFDATLQNGERYHESAMIAAGDQAVVVRTPFGCVGMTICYDLRFGALFRALAQSGAHIITVPAAFTQTTGRAHWHKLLQARAIETGAFIVAPGQTGSHAGGRQTFGHSLIVDPYGKIIADAGEKIGYFVTDISISCVDEVRRRIPSLEHDRQFSSTFVDSINQSDG